jgi:hypothetical protein
MASAQIPEFHELECADTDKPIPFIVGFRKVSATEAGFPIFEPIFGCSPLPIDLDQLPDVAR